MSLYFIAFVTTDYNSYQQGDGDDLYSSVRNKVIELAVYRAFDSMKTADTSTVCSTMPAKDNKCRGTKNAYWVYTHNIYRYLCFLSYPRAVLASAALLFTERIA